MRLILLGPPGLGKGTQAKLLSEAYKARHISSGDLLRLAMEKNSPAGKLVEPFMKSGNLVPDELIQQIVQSELESQGPVGGFILDGFPRTLEQARAFDAWLEHVSLRVDIVVALMGTLDVILRRVSQRRSCRTCGRSFTIGERGLRDEKRCPVCGGELYIREDDIPETVTHRFSVYESRTAPLISYYEKQQLLERIDGTGSIEQTLARILIAVASRPSTSQENN